MNKPTYEELERALIVMVTSAAAAIGGGEEGLEEPARAFFEAITDDDLEKTAEVVNAVAPKFFPVGVSE